MDGRATLNKLPRGYYTKRPSFFQTRGAFFLRAPARFFTRLWAFFCSLTLAAHSKNVYRPQILRLTNLIITGWLMASQGASQGGCPSDPNHTDFRRTTKTPQNPFRYSEARRPHALKEYTKKSRLPLTRACICVCVCMKRENWSKIDSDVCSK